MKFYNSLTKNIETFPKKDSINIYSCGPTVYDFAHIGNLRTFLFEDLLIRTLKDAGYKVIHTRNITDVDDKTIQSAQEQKISLSEFTTKYTEEFFNDLKNLNFDQSTTTYLKATEYITPMITMIQELIDKNHAYETEDGVYFKTSSFNHYGDFAGLNLENIQQGASGSNSDFVKEDFGDFVLWKKHKESDGDVYWESAWGKGRPGWHTECAAMVNHQYPEGLDIHTGGIDLLFPHHTNEKAHCECLSSKPMAKFWLHATHLLVDNKKMSKSLGNFYTVRDLIAKGFDYKTIRFYLQTEAHYRSPLNFTIEGLKGAESALKRINNFICEVIEKLASTSDLLKNKFDNLVHKIVPKEIYNHSHDKLKERFNNLVSKFFDHPNDQLQDEITMCVNDMFSSEINGYISEAFLKEKENFEAYLNDLLKENSYTDSEDSLKNKFDSYLHDDLNIPGAMGEIFTTINNFYKGVAIDTKNTLKDLKRINVILDVFDFPQENILDDTTQKLYDLRIIARQEKNWSESDRLRDELLSHGIEIRDSKDGVSIRKI